MLQVKDAVLANRNLQILTGYIAFNARDRDTLEGLFCDHAVWHKMGGGTITGKQAIVDYLIDLYDQGTRAEFVGAGSQDPNAITLDFTTDFPGEPDHFCADKIKFEGGCIKEVWHCATDTR